MTYKRSELTLLLSFQFSKGFSSHQLSRCCLIHQWLKSPENKCGKRRNSETRKERSFTSHTQDIELTIDATNKEDFTLFLLLFVNQQLI